MNAIPWRRSNADLGLTVGGAAAGTAAGVGRGWLTGRDSRAAARWPGRRSLLRQNCPWILLWKLARIFLMFAVLGFWMTSWSAKPHVSPNAPGNRSDPSKTNVFAA